MTHRVVVVVDVEAVGQFGLAHLGTVGEEVSDVPVGAVETFGDGVDLGAVAGRDEDDLTDVVHAGQPVQCLLELVTTHRHLLEQGQRRALVIQSDGDDGHVGRAFRELRVEQSILAGRAPLRQP